VVLVLLVITILFTYPVSLHPAGYVIGRPLDDAFESIWFLQWYKQALLELRVSPFFQPDVFYPHGWDLRFTILPPLYPILMAPVTAVLGPVTAYNLLIIVSTVVAAFGIYVLVRAIDGSALGGIFAGVAYGFYPNRQVYMHGFLNLLLASMWLPWMVFALYQAVNRPQARGRWLALAVLAFALSIAGAWQYVYIATFTVFVFSLLYLAPDIVRERQKWIKPLIVAGLLLVLTVASQLLFGLINKTRVGTSIDFPLSDLIETGVSIERMLVPSALNPIFWDLARERYPLWNGEDGVVGFGIIVIVLAVVGVVKFNFKPRARWAFLILALTGLLLMAGPFLKFQGKPVTFSWPAAEYLADINPDLVAETGAIRVPMPALLIYEIVPPLRSFHHFGRLGMVVVLCLGTLAGLGITSIQKQLSPHAGSFFGIAVLLLLIVELNPQPHKSITSVAGMHRPVDDWLANQPEQKVIMEYPAYYSFRPRALYNALTHQQKIIHGSSIVSPEYLEERLILEQWPEEPAIDLLEQLGANYVLLHVPREQEDFSTEELPGLLENERLELVGHFTNDPTEPIPLFLWEHIEPLEDSMQETYLFELVGK
jgi:hypothetical protein